MKTLTLTSEKARNLTIPATGELLRDWTGPVEMLGLHTSRPDLWVLTAYGPGGMANGCARDRLRLPLSNPAVIDRLYRVFAAGQECPTCCGVVSSSCLGGAPGCYGTGYLRPPADLSHFRGVKADGWGPELEAALLWVSWVRMAGGMGPIRGWLGPLREDWQDGVMYAPKRDFVGGEHRGHAYCGPDDRPLSEGFALLDITPEGPTLRALVP